MRSRTFLASFLLIVFLCGHSLAQQAKLLPNQTGWLLEITYLKDAPPAYERVRLPGSKMPGDWFGRFGHVAGWQLPAGALPIRAVRVSNRLRTDETIRVRVSVMRGEKYLDAEETVISFDLRENEKVTAKALENFGIEPFEIRAMRTDALPSILPTVVNKTTAIEVLGIQPVPSDMPEYKLTLHNSSAKTVEALQVELIDGWGQLASGMPQGSEGRPLMLSGETIQQRFPMIVNAAGTASAFAPAVPQQQQIIIKSVVFGDGTSEGITEREIQSGSGFKSVNFGRSIELQRALPLFAAALESTEGMTSDGDSRLRLLLEGMNLSLTDVELAELQRRFPTRDTKLLKQWAEFGIHFMRKEMLDQLDRFQTSAHREDFRSWLVNAKERYSNWMARLEPTDTSLP